MDYDKIKVEETCGGCPHCFHFYEDGKEVGGIRYRWGHFQCWPVVNDEYLDNIIDVAGPTDAGIIGHNVQDAVVEYCKECIVDWHNGQPIRKNAENYITKLLNN